MTQMPPLTEQEAMLSLLDQPVSMRDSVLLSTDVYLPAGARAGSRYPVVLERTPYGKHASSRTERGPASDGPMTRAEVARSFTDRGFAVVYQDCRGRHASGGNFTKYLSDAADGYDTCAWIVAQPWSDGSIGTMGLSYAAHTQMALGCLDAPGLRSMFVDSGGFFNGFQSGIRQGGAYELKQAAWAILFAQSVAQRAGDASAATLISRIDVEDWFRRMPWSRGNSPLSGMPEYEDFLFDQWERGAFDDYWRQPGIFAEGYMHLLARFASVQMSSWYDCYTRTAVENYMALKSLGANVRLILGPWTHGNRWLTHAGDVDFGADSVFEGGEGQSFLEARLDWFDQTLKALPPVRPAPAVRLFTMGGGSGRRNAAGRLQHGGRWVDAADWPLPETCWTRYFFHPHGGLDTCAATSADGARSYDFDPRNPVPTLGGGVVSRPPGILAGPFDQKTDPRFFGCSVPGMPLAERPDVLAFCTDVLEQDLELTGPIVAHLWITSDCVDTDFTIKLVDLYPPSADYPEGFALNITDGIRRARYRDSWEKPELMTPGEPYRIAVEAFPTSNLFKAGHRIRVDISSSNFPHFDVNFNTGEPEARATHARTANNTVLMNSTHMSEIVLPVIPR